MAYVARSRYAKIQMVNIFFARSEHRKSLKMLAQGEENFVRRKKLVLYREK